MEVSGRRFLSFREAVSKSSSQQNLTTWSGGRSSSLREEVFVQYLYGSFREEVLKFQGRCFEELLTKKLDDVVRGEVVKFEGGGMCPISVFVPYFILWKNQKRVALDLHKKQCRDKGEPRPISKFCFFHF